MKTGGVAPKLRIPKKTVAIKYGEVNLKVVTKT